jgi:hypothetical protein
MVLRELYLFLSLRRDEKNIGATEKRDSYWKTTGAKKNI